MARQGISFTLPNDEWLRAQVESEGCNSKNDVMNELIRIHQWGRLPGEAQAENESVEVLAIIGRQDAEQRL